MKEPRVPSPETDLSRLKKSSDAIREFTKEAETALGSGSLLLQNLRTLYSSLTALTLIKVDFNTSVNNVFFNLDGTYSILCGGEDETGEYIYETVTSIPDLVSCIKNRTIPVEEFREKAYDDKLYAIQKACEVIKMTNAIFSTGRIKVGLDINGAYCTLLHSLQRHLITMTEEYIGDAAESLDWFIYENDFGKKGHSIFWKNIEYKIRTEEDLLNSIEQLK